MTKEDAYLTLWGWEGGMLRLPLPPVAWIPAVKRSVGNIGGITELVIPPYLVFHSEAGTLDIYRGDGWRASRQLDAGVLAPTSDSTARLSDADRKMVDGSWLFADSDDLPEEWMEPVADAIAEIEEKYPDVKIRFRP